MERTLLDEIKPFYVMDVLERAKAMERDGIDVVHLEVGEPDFDMPEPVKQAAIRAMDQGHTHYTHSLGMIELREAIAADYDKRYGVTVDPEHIVVTNGTSPAIFLTFAALLEHGDEVIVSDPHYACYPNFIRLAGGMPRLVSTLEEDGFQFRASAIRGAMNDRTRAVFLNSPSNPVGTLMPPERMKNVAELGLPIVSDEIYHGLVYGGQRDHTVLEFTKNCFVLNGFSKLYAMTGLRLGYLIAPEIHKRDLQKLCQNLFISPNSVSQWAGIAALTQCEEDVERMKAVYDERRRYMVARLREIGFTIAVEPFGAFYVFANARKFGADSYSLAFDILENAHVGVTPGTDFGQGGEGFIRFSYANSLENIERGLDRVERYLKTV